jgi:hypothetical protein
MLGMAAKHTTSTALVELIHPPSSGQVLRGPGQVPLPANRGLSSRRNRRQEIRVFRITLEVEILR